MFASNCNAKLFKLSAMLLSIERSSSTVISKVFDRRNLLGIWRLDKDFVEMIWIEIGIVEHLDK